jgi:hypothetical protein
MVSSYTCLRHSILQRVPRHSCQERCASPKAAGAPSLGEPSSIVLPVHFTLQDHPPSHHPSLFERERERAIGNSVPHLPTTQLYSIHTRGVGVANELEVVLLQRSRVCSGSAQNFDPILRPYFPDLT